MQVAPITVPHVVSLLRSGCYNSNQFFRVDKGFVAQVSDVVSGRLTPLSPRQREEAERSVPLEAVQGVRHHAGTLSMARHADRNSGKSSFSVLLGDAPHLDMQYTVFGCAPSPPLQADPCEPCSRASRVRVSSVLVACSQRGAAGGR